MRQWENGKRHACDDLATGSTPTVICPSDNSICTAIRPREIGRKSLAYTDLEFMSGRVGKIPGKLLDKRGIITHYNEL